MSYRLLILFCPILNSFFNSCLCFLSISVSFNIYNLFKSPTHNSKTILAYLYLLVFYHKNTSKQLSNQKFNQIMNKMLRHVRVSQCNVWSYRLSYRIFFLNKKFSLVQFRSNLRTHTGLILMALLPIFLKPTLSFSVWDNREEIRPADTKVQPIAHFVFNMYIGLF